MKNRVFCYRKKQSRPVNQEAPLPSPPLPPKSPSEEPTKEEPTKDEHTYWDPIDEPTYDEPSLIFLLVILILKVKASKFLQPTDEEEEDGTWIEHFSIMTSSHERSHGVPKFEGPLKCGRFFKRNDDEFCRYKKSIVIGGCKPL